MERTNHWLMVGSSLRPSALSALKLWLEPGPLGAIAAGGTSNLRY